MKVESVTSDVRIHLLFQGFAPSAGFYQTVNGTTHVLKSCQ